MFRSWVSLLVLAAALCGGQAAPPARVRVLTYNIHAGVGMDKRLDIERIAGVINGAKPDIVALQEVDRSTRRSGSRDLAGELAKATAMKAAFGKAMDHDGGEYGVAVLVLGEIAGSRVHAIGNSPGHEPRVILESVVRLKKLLNAEDAGKGVVLRVFSTTHFDHRSAEDRKRGAELAVRLAAESDGPAILAGDLNAVPDAAELAPLKAQWRFAGEGQALLTIPVVVPNRQIDYVLYRPAARWKVVSVEVIDEKVASDHRPLLAVLELSAK
ncbi:MAG TPA: endonuclease/exonuclease/phosphatase family protein [Bryobacteraceae bacterium]|nr:endonuclease/exonuclease/phosphatase family protein [Bryobacteraceae bacterium]